MTIIEMMGRVNNFFSDLVWSSKDKLYTERQHNYTDYYRYPQGLDSVSLRSMTSLKIVTRSTLLHLLNYAKKN